MFYYAFIDENNICTGVYAMPSEIPVATYIPITEEQYTSQSVVGKRYDAETNTFVDVPVWTCNASEVQYGTGAVSVADALDAINEELDGLGGSSDPVDAYTKAESDEKYATADHTHAGFANASHTHTAGDVTGVVKTINGTTPDENGNVNVSVDGGSGTPGADGADGEDGATFTPSVSDDGVLSWTNDKGLANPSSVNIRGPQGIQGIQGEPGPAGADGQNGANGVSPTVSINKTGTVTTIVITDANGTHTATINDGANGEDGAPGTEITAAQILSKLIGVDGSGSGLDADKLDGYDSSAFATAGHSHSEYAPSNHSHNGYASSGHSHSDYLPTSGGTVNGNLNVTGILRVNGQQAVYDSGTMVTLSTNNRETMIAGSKIYSKTTISVSSDRRLKENIEEVSADDMTKFINGLGIKTFNYIGNDEECIGVIAQEVTESNPELAKYFVRQNENGYYSVKASDLVFPLIATVQKLAKEIEELKK